MSKYKITFEVYMDDKKKEWVPVEIEAGNKKLAVLRAMQELGKVEKYKMTYKNVISVEEVKQ